MERSSPKTEQWSWHPALLTTVELPAPFLAQQKPHLFPKLKYTQIKCCSSKLDVKMVWPQFENTHFFSKTDKNCILKHEHSTSPYFSSGTSCCCMSRLLYVMVTFYLSPHMCHGCCEMSRHLILSRLFSWCSKTFQVSLANRFF